MNTILKTLIDSDSPSVPNDLAVIRLRMDELMQINEMVKSLSSDELRQVPKQLDDGQIVFLLKNFWSHINDCWVNLNNSEPIFTQARSQDSACITPPLIFQLAEVLHWWVINLAVEQLLNTK